LIVGLRIELFIADGSKSEDAQDSSKTSGFEDVYFVSYGGSNLPRFCTIEILNLVLMLIFEDFLMFLSDANTP
jgi:hypothetical protein